MLSYAVLVLEVLLQKLAFLKQNYSFNYVYVISHAELILEKGVIIMTKHPNFIQGDSKCNLNLARLKLSLIVLDFYLVEEFFYAACELQSYGWAQLFLRMTR